MNPYIILAIIILALALVFIILSSSKKNKKTNVSLSKKASSKKFSLSSIFSATAINEELFVNLENSLIEADCGVNCVKEIITKLRNNIEEKKITTVSGAKEELKNILLSLFKNKKLDIGSKTILFIVGVNGVGKTTTIAKLSNLLKEKYSIILAASDTFRAAAIEQLETWAVRLSIDIVKGQQAADPTSVMFQALEKAKKNNTDIVIVDTAGRFHNQDNLIRQLEKMKKTANERFGEYRFIPILILDANVGHNGIEQARVFLSSLNIEGVIISKLDSTAKGGVAIAISHYLNLPIFYAGYGEKISDFREFNVHEFIDSIL